MGCFSQGGRIEAEGRGKPGGRGGLGRCQAEGILLEVVALVDFASLGHALVFVGPGA